jgi:hypothetical protein
METPQTDEPNPWLGLSLKSLVLIFVGIILFVWYVRILLFGENSLTVLNQLREEKANLLQESQTLKLSNQKHQKKYFELIQLSSD